MNKRVLKYTFKDLPEQVVFLPERSKIIHYDWQDNHICFWFESIGSGPKIPRTFFLLYTNENIPDNCEHRATLVRSGKLVFHIYEKSVPHL